MKKNIVLIGMPSCGKSTLAKLLANHFSMHWVDSDIEIEKEMHMPIAQIFQDKGEAYFRDIEHQIILRLSSMENTIIATGGGVVIREANMRALKKQGFILFIDRDISLLSASDPTRPLSNRLETLHTFRYPLYKKYADAIVENNGKIKEVMPTLLRIIGGTIYDHNNQ